VPSAKPVNVTSPAASETAVATTSGWPSPSLSSGIPSLFASAYKLIETSTIGSSLASNTPLASASNQTVSTIVFRLAASKPKSKSVTVEAVDVKVTGLLA